MKWSLVGTVATALAPVASAAPLPTCAEAHAVLDRFKRGASKSEEMLNALRGCSDLGERADLALEVARSSNPAATASHDTPPPAAGGQPHEPGAGDSSKEASAPKDRKNPAAKGAARDGSRKITRDTAGKETFEAAIQVTHDTLTASLEPLETACHGDLASCSSETLLPFLKRVSEYLKQVLRAGTSDDAVKRAAGLLGDLPGMSPELLDLFARLLETERLPEDDSATRPPAEADPLATLHQVLDQPGGKERVKKLLDYLLSGDPKEQDQRQASLALAVRLHDVAAAREIMKDLARHGRVSMLVGCELASDDLCTKAIEPELVRQLQDEKSSTAQTIYTAPQKGRKHDVEIAVRLVDPAASPSDASAPCTARANRQTRCMRATVNLGFVDRLTLWSTPFDFFSPEANPPREVSSAVAGLLHGVMRSIADAYAFRDMWIGPVQLVEQSKIHAAPDAVPVKKLPKSALRAGLFIGRADDPAGFSGLRDALDASLRRYEREVFKSIERTPVDDQVEVATTEAGPCGQSDGEPCRSLLVRLMHHQKRGDQGTELLGFRIEAPAESRYVHSIAEHALDRILKYYLAQGTYAVAEAGHPSEAGPLGSIAQEPEDRSSAGSPSTALLFAGLPYPAESDERRLFSWLDLGLTASSIGLVYASTQERAAYSAGDRDSLHSANALLWTGVGAFAGLVVTRLVSLGVSAAQTRSHENKP